VPTVDVTTWYLEMTDPAQLAPALPPDPALTIERIDPPAPELSRALYEAVGADWNWTDRLGWTAERWRRHIERPELETWVAKVDGEHAGYAELEHAGDAVELVSFGLLPAFIGRGIGPRLLHAATRRAWERGPRRVWLHTCSLDSPAALPTYRRAGFVLYDERTAPVELPPRG
jgi:ribosomal protein S18 acetylase RimI-like enzyme